MCELARPTDHVALMAVLATMTSRSRLLAGGTDLVPWLHAHGTDGIDLLVDLSAMRELADVTCDGRAVRVGALATFAQLATDPLIATHAPLLATAAAQVGSTQVRNAATIGGNVANASPCADGVAVLVALDAGAVLVSRDMVRVVPLTELLGASGRPSLAVGEMIAAFEFEMPTPNARSAFAKVGARTAVTVAKVSIAIVVELDPATGLIAQASVAFGSLAPAAFRASALEASLVRRPLDDHTGRVLAVGCRDVVLASIPGRASLPYKRHAILGAAADVWQSLTAPAP